MILHSTADHSQLFTLRVWPAELSEGHLEWRGKIQHVISGETFYFRDWVTLLTLLQQLLASPDEEPLTGSEKSDQE